MGLVIGVVILTWDTAVGRHQTKQKKLEKMVRQADEKYTTIIARLDTDEARYGMYLGAKYAVTEMSVSIDKIMQMIPE